MIIHNPILTGSFTYNGIDLSSVTSSTSNISSLNAITASILSTTGSLNTASGSAITRLGALEVTSGSNITRLSALETASGSAITRLSSIETVTGSNITRLNSIETVTGSNITRLSSLEAKTGSYATTGSNTFIGTQTISGSILQSGSFTSTGTLTAQTLVVQTITSSVVYSSGSNVFGNTIGNTQTFTGSVNITGSLNANNTLYISSSNVGIGTNNPQSIFHIGSPAPSNSGVKAYTGLANSYEGFLFDYYYNTAASNLRVFDIVALGASTTGIGGSDIRFLTVPQTTTGTALERLRITSGGNVGIGNIAPTNKLSITNNGDAVVAFRINDTNANASFLSLNASNTDSAIIAGGTSAIPFDIYTGGSVRLRVTSGGDILLQFAGNRRIGIDYNFAGDYFYGFATNSNARQTRIICSAPDANAGISFETGASFAAATSKMLITSGGNVLIGHTTESSFKLDVRSSSGNNFVQSYTQLSSNGQQCGYVANSLWSGSERGVTWAMYKHVGITNPATYISFWSGTSTFQYMHMDDSGVLRLSSSSGDIGTANGTIVGTQTSDIRLKNVKESFNYGLSDILKINPIAFTFKNDINNADKLGFSAQEMLNIIPESVYDTKTCIDGYDDTDDSMVKIPKSNNTVYGMDYTTLIPVLVKAIQELKAEFDAYKATHP